MDTCAGFDHDRNPSFPSERAGRFDEFRFLYPANRETELLLRGAQGELENSPLFDLATDVHRRGGVLIVRLTPREFSAPAKGVRGRYYLDAELRVVNADREIVATRTVSVPYSSAKPMSEFFRAREWTESFAEGFNDTLLPLRSPVVLGALEPKKAALALQPAARAEPAQLDLPHTRAPVHSGCRGELEQLELSLKAGSRP